MNNLNLTDFQKEQIEKISKNYKLKFVILYGSFVSGKTKKDSDLDIGILGEKKTTFDELLDLFYLFSELFPSYNLDIKSLHEIDPFFRYNVVKNGILLYGNSTDYLNFKYYAFSDFRESKSLFKLQEILIQKRLKYLRENL